MCQREVPTDKYNTISPATHSNRERWAFSEHITVCFLVLNLIKMGLPLNAIKSWMVREDNSTDIIGWSNASYCITIYYITQKGTANAAPFFI